MEPIWAIVLIVIFSNPVFVTGDNNTVIIERGIHVEAETHAEDYNHTTAGLSVNSDRDR